MDYHPLQKHNITRIKRSETYDLYRQYHTQTRELTPSEENFLDAFMRALYKINPSLHKNLSHMKRVGIFTWILGWGVFSNARNILKIKDERSKTYDLYKQYHTQTRELTPSEENFLDAFMRALYKINPSLHKNLSHMKRVGIFTWILGWGVFSNARNYIEN